jgi:CAAX protease family protein
MLVPNLLELRFGMSEPELLESAIIGLEMLLDQVEDLAQTLGCLHERFVRTEPDDVLHGVLHGRERASSRVHGPREIYINRAGFRGSSPLAFRNSSAKRATGLVRARTDCALVLLALSHLSPELLPRIFTTNDKASLLLFGLAVGLGAGFFEELGWTGFAVPALRLRYGVLTTGLLVGGLWGAWHLLAAVWGIGNRSGALPLALFVTLDLFSALPAFRVLMVWVYGRTGSLLVGMLMHSSLTSSLLILTPLTTGVPLLTFDLVFAAALWVVVAAVALASGWQLSRQPLRRRAAS